MSALALQAEGDDWRLSLERRLVLGGMAQIDRELEALLGSRERHLGLRLVARRSARESARCGRCLTRLSDLGGANLERPPRGRSAAHAAVPAEAQARTPCRDCTRGSRTARASRARSADSGRWAVLQGGEARGVLGFFGRIAAVLGQAFSRPRALRVPSLARHIYETGVTAIPIVSLIAFLISVVVAYLGAQQLSKFGADIFVVDLVTIAVLREMGVLLTAIIVAGRSGSAFAAEIGVMQLNEETDALRAMGMNPIELLVVPRVLALVIALPLVDRHRRCDGPRRRRTSVADPAAHPAARNSRSACAKRSRRRRSGPD